ncbi:MAG: alpha/beta hydrolase [Planctomycetota bacterium]|jgi:alpha/beta superfamily hydrolase
MREKTVFFPARSVPGVALEGRLLDGGGRPCVVSHPHPLAGGDMDHPVVVALWRTAAKEGYRSLRYNFRGVGSSTGELTESSPLATADLAGALDYLGGGPALAMGYSYGARTTLHAIYAGEAIAGGVLVAIPTRLPTSPAAFTNVLLGRPERSGDFEATPDLEMIAGAPRPVRVVAGDKDPLVVIEDLRDRGVEPSIIEGVNHFFSHRLGNQMPAPADLDRLCGYAVEFLRTLPEGE